MLKALHIRNYILIDSLDVAFPEGLLIITGQTGAGKSILLGALSLLMGAKSDASVISDGADSCVVEAEFDSESDEVRTVLEESDVEWEDGHLTIRRVVHASGRSRSFINDSPVTVGVLSAISSRLVDIHSQHQSLLLADRSFQLSMLDSYAGNAALLDQCRSEWKTLLSLRSELSGIEGRLARLASDRDYNASRYERLEAAHLRDGEVEELEAEQRQLANAEEIKESLTAAGELFNPASDEGPGGISTMLKDAGRALAKVSRYMDVSALEDRLEAARIELDDIASEIDALNQNTDVSSDRLQTVEDRMSLLYDLLNRHGCQTVAELIAERDALSAALYDSSALEERCAALKDEISACRARYESVCLSLHASRLAAAGPFAQSIENSIRYLELDRAVFKVELTSQDEGPLGKDAVGFLFSANGTAPEDVAKCASGGELSRIMLCLKAMMARFSAMPTMIFDEIDTGVSGSVADKMGSMICSMGEDMQVFAITHLPQVAAKGSAHYLVSKDSGEKVTSTIKKLSPEERVMEIARMLSGSVITDSAVANARTLLGQQMSI